MLILKLLEAKDRYGYQIIEELSRQTNETFCLKTGTLYPILHGLENDGMVTSYDENAGNARVRKYYRLTSKGKGLLQKNNRSGRPTEQPSTLSWKEAPAMHSLEKIGEYVNLVCRQIRWRKAQPRVAEKIKNHLINGRDAYMAQGFDEEAATKKAITDTGDATVIGAKLDRKHCPKPQ